MSSIRRNLSEYLVRCCGLQLLCEKVREKIAENRYFQIQTVFQRFDKFKKGYLVPDDLSEFMLENKLYPTEIELYLIFREFDKERVGVVTLQRFSEELLPKENLKVTKKALERKYYEEGVRLAIDLQFIIARYFEHKIKEIKELAILRSQMSQKQALLVEQSFSLIDQKGKGVIEGLSQLDSFLRSNGKVLGKEQLTRIFRVLNFGRQGPILYDTFAQSLDPLGRGYYIGYSQRLAQKNLAQQQYLRQKLALQSETARQQGQRIAISNSIAQLQVRNSRLQGLLRDQVQQQRILDQVQSIRRRRLY